MEDTPYQKTVLKSPLSEDTKAERRYLLVVSALGIIMVKAGLIPSKVGALGIEFNPNNTRTLLIILAIVVSYFTGSFFFYALADFYSYRVEVYLSGFNLTQQVNKSIKERAQEIEQTMHELEQITLRLDEYKNTWEFLQAFIKDAEATYRDINDLIKNREGPTEEFQAKGHELQNRLKLITEQKTVVQDKAAGLVDKEEGLKIIQAALNEKLEIMLEIKAMNEHNETFLRKGLRSRIIAYPRLILDFIIPIIAGVAAAFYLIRGH